VNSEWQEGFGAAANGPRNKPDFTTRYSLFANHPFPHTGLR
jgi:hypothetical protein